MTDVKEILQKKILINDLSSKNLKIQIELADCYIAVQNKIKDVCQQKLELVNRLDEMYRNQIINFTYGRQYECLRLVERINQLDNQNISEINEKIEKHKKEMAELCMQIAYLESTIK
jgi:ABC-type phosphate transport system auxiliary subunit